MQRKEALALVNEWTQAPHLRRHMLAVEAAMRAYARKFGADEDTWGLVGLLHDFDYERFGMDGHVVKGVPLLREKGLSDEVLHAILAHYESATNVKPDTKLDQTLMAVDETTGFIVAVTLVRPSKSILDVEISSIKKKWKAKEFAAAVNRAEIEHFAGAIGVTLDEHLGLVLNAMKTIADDLGLKGEPSG
jgi:putative nucleotidyltransferase with HDIG domain